MMSPDAWGFPSWEAEDPSDVAILVEVEIGEEGQPGVDLFQVMLVTPKGLERMTARKSEPVILDRALVVMREVSAPAFEEAFFDYEKVRGRYVGRDGPQSTAVFPVGVRGLQDGATLIDAAGALLPKGEEKAGEIKVGVQLEGLGERRCRA